MNTSTRPGLIALLIAAACCPASAGSIWAKANTRTRNIYADDTAASVGDILTVVIEEKSKIANGVSRKLDKSSSRKGSIDGSVQLRDIWPGRRKETFNLPKVDYNSSAETKFDGSADYDSDRSMVDQITVTVEDVLPNGALVVLGKRTRDVEGDRQVIQVSGIVRPRDITFANTVKSKQVAEFHIVYRSTGREKRFTRPGWLGRLLNFFNPF